LGVFQGKITEAAVAIALDQSFTLSSTNADDLTALWLVIRYSVSP
jgi:hypothetical protein